MHSIDILDFSIGLGCMDFYNDIQRDVKIMKVFFKSMYRINNEETKIEKRDIPSLSRILCMAP